MGAVTPSAYGLRGDNTTHFVATLTDADTIVKADLIAGLATTSRLRAFITGAYANAAAADLAFRALGGYVNMRQVGSGTAGTSTPVLTWTVAGNVITELNVACTGLLNEVCEIQIGILHSIFE